MSVNTAGGGGDDHDDNLENITTDLSENETSVSAITTAEADFQ